MSEFYLPGKLLGTEEEFIPGDWAYVEDGRIYSCTTGGAEIGSDRRINIKPLVTVPSLIRAGMMVYGRVEEIFEPVALVRIDPVESGNIRQSSVRLMSVLHVSKVKNGYVRNVRDCVRIGDVIKARVEDVRKGEVYLNIKDNNLGVVKAFCSRCRSPLVLRDMLLQCTCGSREMRKLSSDYGMVRI